MKAKIFTACAIIMLIVSCLVTQANPVRDDSVIIINEYINGFINNDYKLWDKILDDDATIKLPRGEVLLIHSRQDVVKLMHDNGIIHQKCTYNYEILAKSGALIIARVDFNYENAVHHNFLTIEKTPQKDWKITQICKVIDDKEPAGSSGALTVLK